MVVNIATLDGFGYPILKKLIVSGTLISDLKQYRIGFRFILFEYIIYSKIFGSDIGLGVMGSISEPNG